MRFSVTAAIFFCSFFPDDGATRRASTAPVTAPMPNPTATLPKGNFRLRENMNCSFQGHKTRDGAKGFGIKPLALAGDSILLLNSLQIEVRAHGFVARKHVSPILRVVVGVDEREERLVHVPVLLAASDVD